MIALIPAGFNVASAAWSLYRNWQTAKPVVERAYAQVAASAVRLRKGRQILDGMTPGPERDADHARWKALVARHNAVASLVDTKLEVAIGVLPAIPLSYAIAMGAATVTISAVAAYYLWTRDQEIAAYAHAVSLFERELELRAESMRTGVPLPPSTMKLPNLPQASLLPTVSGTGSAVGLAVGLGAVVGVGAIVAMAWRSR